jgi:hypothetical protein
LQTSRPGQPVPQPPGTSRAEVAGLDSPALWPATGIGYTCEEHGRPTERRVTNCSWHERHEASSRRGGLQRLAARFRNPSLRPRLKFASILESKRIGQAGDWRPVSIRLVCLGRDRIGVQAERLEPSRYGGQMDLRCPAHSGIMAIRSRSTALRDPITGAAGVSLSNGPSPAPEYVASADLGLPVAVAPSSAPHLPNRSQVLRRRHRNCFGAEKMHTSEPAPAPTSLLSPPGRGAVGPLCPQQRARTGQPVRGPLIAGRRRMQLVQRQSLAA